MKKLNSLVSIISLLLLFTLALTSCDFFGPQPEPSDTEKYTLHESLGKVERGETLYLQKDLLIMDQHFIPNEKQGGYVSAAQISATITGLDNDFTYFGASVTITWTYNEISELNPKGIDKTFSTTIGLDADGCGHYSNQISFQGCRDIKVISVDYTYVGTATRK